MTENISLQQLANVYIISVMFFNNGGGYNFLYDRFENATERNKTRQLYRSDRNAGKLLGANSHHVEKEKASRAYQQCARTIGENYLSQ